MTTATRIAYAVHLDGALAPSDDGEPVYRCADGAVRFAAALKERDPEALVTIVLWEEPCPA